jgi:hypothetical protein
MDRHGLWKQRRPVKQLGRKLGPKKRPAEAGPLLTPAGCSAARRLFEVRRRLEPQTLGRFDLDAFAGARIATDARATLGGGKGAEGSNLQLAAAPHALKSRLDGTEYKLDGTFGVRLADFTLFGNRLDEICLAHVRPLHKQPLGSADITKRRASAYGIVADTTGFTQRDSQKPINCWYIAREAKSRKPVD